MNQLHKEIKIKKELKKIYLNNNYNKILDVIEEENEVNKKLVKHKLRPILVSKEISKEECNLDIITFGHDILLAFPSSRDGSILRTSGSIYLQYSDCSLKELSPYFPDTKHLPANDYICEE